MSNKKYPWSIAIYKGEERLLVIPFVRHIAGFSVHTECFEVLNEMENSLEIGSCVFRAIEIIRNSPLASNSPKEREKNATWKKASKYKSWVAFWRNNHYTSINIHQSGEYEVYSTEKTQERKGGYNGCIKKISLPSIATAEEIGEAVIDVFKAAEDFYEKKDN